IASVVSRAASAGGDEVHAVQLGVVHPIESAVLDGDVLVMALDRRAVSGADENAVALESMEEASPHGELRAGAGDEQVVVLGEPFGLAASQQSQVLDRDIAHVVARVGRAAALRPGEDRRAGTMNEDARAARALETRVGP